MNSLDGLRNDYLEYLRDCGVDVPTDKLASAALASALEEIARTHPDELLRRSVMEHLEAAATLQKLSGCPVDDTPARLAVGIGSSDLARYVDVVLAGLTEDDTTALRDMPIYFGVVPRGWFNAMVAPSRHGRLCLLDTGLSTLLFGLSKAVAFLVERSPSGVLGAPVAESGFFDERVTLAYSAAAAAALNYLTQAEAGGHNFRYKPAFLPAQRYEPWQIIVANALTFAMKSFVMAHEIGHAVLGHVGEAVTVIRRDIVTQTVLGSSHDQEFAADRFAFEVLLRSEGVLRPKYPLSVGGICFLTCYLFLLRMRTRLTGIQYGPDEPSESHPAPLDRIRRLVAFAVAEQDTIHPAFLAMTGLFRKLLEVDHSMDIDFNADGSLNVRPNHRDSQ